MRHLFFLLTLLLALTPANAGTPLKINFQGRLDESGHAAQGTKNFVFKIYDALSAGNLLWTSQTQSVIVANGAFSVVLETGTPVNLSTASFAGGRYVEIAVDGVQLSPRQEMVSAPYALVAQALSADARISLSNLEKDPSAPSVINTATNAVDWTQLKNVPANLASGAAETDPVFTASPAYGITASSTGRWNSWPGAETDPLFSGSPAFDITAASTSKWNTWPGAETDPLFSGSPAFGITTANIAAWNSGIGAETDPVFKASPAYGITASTINSWNTEPIFSQSAAAGITLSSTSNWNNESKFTSSPAYNITFSSFALWDSWTGSESDPVYAASPASGITLSAISTWNGLRGDLDTVIVSTGRINGRVNALFTATATITDAQIADEAVIANIAVDTGTVYGWGNHALAGYSKLSATQSFTGVNTFSTVKLTGAVSLPVKTVTADYTATAADGTILVDASGGDVTVLLPPASGVIGRTYTIKRVDSTGNNVTVGADGWDGATGVEYIENAFTFTLSNQWDYETLQSAGTIGANAVWIVLSQNL